MCSQVLEKLHPLGLRDDWADKMAGKSFSARNALTTFEHYMQVRSAAPAVQRPSPAGTAPE